MNFDIAKSGFKLYDITQALSRRIIIMKEFSSGGIIARLAQDKLKILLIKDSYGRWTWPKGKIENGESKEAAAKREIAEEVGLSSIDMIRELDKIEYVYKLKDQPIFKTVYLFLFELVKDEKLAPLEKEIQDAVWASPSEALEKLDYKGAKEIMQRAIECFKDLKGIE